MENFHVKTFSPNSTICSSYIFTRIQFKRITGHFFFISSHCIKYELQIAFCILSDCFHCISRRILSFNSLSWHVCYFCFFSVLLPLFCFRLLSFAYARSNCICERIIGKYYRKGSIIIQVNTRFLRNHNIVKDLEDVTCMTFNIILSRNLLLPPIVSCSCHFGVRDQLRVPHFIKQICGLNGLVHQI